MKNWAEEQYLNLLREIITRGSEKEIFLTPEVKEQYLKEGRKIPYLKSIFGHQMSFNLSDGFPLLTTKKVFFKGVLHELLWFLSGESNIKYLVDNDVHIWDEWAWRRYHKDCLARGEEVLSQNDFISKIKKLSVDNDFVKKWGDLIYCYGRMWRRWPATDGREIDQLAWVIKGLREKPFRKSYLVSSWNPDFIYAMASPQNRNDVPPFCHTMFQLTVTGKQLDLGLYQRSADMFLGVPFNIASYSLLLLMIAQVTGLKAGRLVHTFGDAHIYSDHFEPVQEQLSRDIRPLPSIEINPEIKEIDLFKFEDFNLLNYHPHPAIKAPLTSVGGF